MSLVKLTAGAFAFGIALAACHRASATSAAGPAPQRAAEHAATDSISVDRQRLVQRLMGEIAGNEDRPAADVFMNVQLLGRARARDLVAAMDFYSRSLGVSCSHCHVATDWQADDKPAKRITRRMIAMVDTINERLLAKMDELPADKRSVSCMTCHRGHVQP